MRLTGTLLALLAAALPMTARAATPPTVEWIYSDAGESATAMPEHTWAADGTLLLLDATVPADQRVLERFDPATGTRRPAVDRARAHASLSAVLGAQEVPAVLPWPDDIARAGNRAVYTFAGDLFVLDLASSTFERVTRTPEEETAPRLAPAGARLAFLRDNDLWVADLATGRETRLTRDGSDTVLNGGLSWVYWEEVFNHDDAGYWWAPDSSAIAFLRTDESQVTEMVYTDVSPSIPRVIRQRYPVAGGVNPAVTLGVVDLASGVTHFVDPSAMPCEYILGVTWKPDASAVAVQVTNRRQTRLDLYSVDRATGAAALVLSDPDEAWVDHHELQLLADGRFLWSSERDGHTHLYLYEPGGRLVRRLTRGDWSVRGPESFYSEALGSAWVDEAAGVVYFTALEKSPLERHLYRVGLDGSGFTRLSRSDGVHVVTFSPDRRFYADVHSARCTPPQLSVHRADGTSVAVLARSRANLKAELDWQCPELLTVPAADGKPLYARLIRPRPFDPSRHYPAVVYVYGGPSAPVVKDSWDYSFARNAPFDQVLAHAGYAVFEIDPRSATAASKTAENLVAGHVWSDVELADMLDGVRWLKAQPWVDGDRVGVWGWSGGGTSTVLLMTRSQQFKAGIAVAPEVDWHDYDTRFTEAYMKTPADNPEGYAHTALIPRAADLSGRLMLVTGTYDDNVHSQQIYRLVDGLIAAHKKFDLMVYPMRQHTIDDRPARIDLFNRMLEFWRRNL